MQKFISMLLVIVFLGSVTLWMGCSAIKSSLEQPAKPASATKPVSESVAKPAPKSDVGGIPEGIPAWFLNVPEDPNFVYATAVGQSEILKVAIDTARSSAHVELAMSVDIEVEKFITETGAVVTRVRTGAMIKGVKTVKQVVQREGSMYTVYVLAEMPIEEVKSSILMTIEANEALHAKLKDSPKFKELVKEVEKYKPKT